MALAALVVIIVLAAIASIVAGGRIINSGLNREIEDVTGRRLTYAQGPIIKVFPALTAEFHDVSLHDWKNAGANSPILTAPIMRLSLSAFSALRNEIRITGVALEQPVFQAKSIEGALQFPFGSKSRLARMISALDKTSIELGDTNGLVLAREQAFGSVIINDGKLVFERQAKHDGSISDIDATLLWRAPGFAGSLIAVGKWLGEPTNLEANTNDVVQLLAGIDTDLAVKLNSKFINARFDGISRLLPNAYFDGKLAAGTSSLANIAKWQGIDAPIGMDDLSLTVEGTLKAESTKWQIEDSILHFGKNKGSGALAFQPLASPPSLSGTVDFADLDLTMVSALFEATAGHDHENGTRPLAIDLRISADTATFGTVALNNVAASLQLSHEASALDINDASLFGGTLQLAIKSENGTAKSNSIPQSELRVLANNIDTGMLAALGNNFAGWPKAKGTLSAILRGPRAEGMQFFDGAEGTIKLRLTEGILPGIEDAALIPQLRSGGFVPLLSKQPSAFAFNELNAEAKLAGGTLLINPLRIGINEAAIELSGAYAMKEDSLALTGKIDLAETHGEAVNGAETIPFFIGGNRHAPLMSALPK